MAYSADSFVADEQPTTAKWNKLWSNDAAFNDGTGIANDAITGDHVSGFKKDNLTTDSNPYKFRARRTSAFTPTAATFTKVTFDTEDFDTNSNFASGTYTAPVSGFYQFHARYSQAGGVPGADFVFALYKNGSAYQRGSHVSSSATNDWGLNYADMIQVTANDTFEVYVYSSNAVAVETGTSQQAYFGGYLISRT